MKHFTFKWLKRLYVLLAVKLVIVAVLLTVVRILFISVEDYKQQAIDWLTTEYQVKVAVEDITAGIDFSGMVLIFDNVELLDAQELPFEVNFDYLFLHLDFWDSVHHQKLNFNRISLQGANITLHDAPAQSGSKKSQLTIDNLKDIFFTQLKKVSVKDSRINYTDKFGMDKIVVINQLQWLNEGKQHQGVGQASFPSALGENSLTFVVDVFPEKKKGELSGNIYLQADNLNISDYLDTRLNDQTEIVEARVGFETWVKFTNNSINSVQVEFHDNQFSWSQFNQPHQLQLNGGSLQILHQGDAWLLDSYDLAMRYNGQPIEQLAFSGKGTYDSARFDFQGLTLENIMPLYLIAAPLSVTQLDKLKRFQLDANINHLQLLRNEQKALQFSLDIDQLENRAVGAIPGIRGASVQIYGGLDAGRADVQLPKQSITFDGQFSRNMPLKKGQLDIQWLQTETGLKLFSEQALIRTAELDTISEFSLFFPNKKAQQQGAFLSLYSYVNLSDASQARHYYPIKAMGKNTYNYLSPTLKKGHVKGAKILWYGALKDYPYSKRNGIFQAWVPVRDAQYDFYGEWEGLSDLDLDLLFENDYLLMDAKKAQLGEVKVEKLSAKIDRLHPRGVLSIDAQIQEDAAKISRYLQASPVKNSVGSALEFVQISKPVAGHISLTIPFKRSQQPTRVEGAITLSNNDLKINLGENKVIPLEGVRGRFNFVDGDLSAQNIQARLFQQPTRISFETQARNNDYQIEVEADGLWQVAPLARYHQVESYIDAEGVLDWSGKVRLNHFYRGGYEYDVTLNSATQGVISRLPEPFNKHTLESWPTHIQVLGDSKSSRLKASIDDKLAFDGVLDYQGGALTVPYFNLNVGQSEILYLDKRKQVIDVNLTQLNLTDWYEYWLTAEAKQKGQQVQTSTLPGLLRLDEVNIDVQHLSIFNQELAAFRSSTVHQGDKWAANIFSDNIQMQAEYRPGIPVRIDINADKINLADLDLSLYQGKELDIEGSLSKVSENLLDDYPEVFIDCAQCIYKNIDLSPLSAHIYPTQKRLTIDYVRVGSESEFINIAGFWDQRLTNIVFDSEGNRKQDIIKRLGYVSPLYYQKAQLSGAVNWVGAPWQANLETLNGALSAEITDGAITEVSDKGTRLLSVFSLDGIQRSLNLEFGNVFAKGFNFDKLTFSSNINDGVASNDDFYLTGSPGKITGSGLVDLPNQHTNYKFSYSPAVTSSLPVLAAFTINPLTGAAVLMLTKILEPVVDTIIRVDFSVKGDLSKPTVKLVTRERGRIKLENSEVLSEMTEQGENYQDEEFYDHDD